MGGGGVVEWVRGPALFHSLSKCIFIERKNMHKSSMTLRTVTLTSIFYDLTFLEYFEGISSNLPTIKISSRNLAYFLYKSRFKFRSKRLIAFREASKRSKNHAPSRCPGQSTPLQRGGLTDQDISVSCLVKFPVNIHFFPKHSKC